MRNAAAVGVWLFAFVSQSLAENVRLDQDMCGLHSLTIVAAALGTDDMDRLRSELSEAAAPFSLADLNRAAQAIGLHGEMLRWRNKHDARFPVPAILHVRTSMGLAPSHFVACLGERDGLVCIVDFPRKPQFMSRYELFERWDGDILYIHRGRGMGWSRRVSAVIIIASLVVCLVVLYRCPVLPATWSTRNRLYVCAALFGAGTLVPFGWQHYQSVREARGGNKPELLGLVAATPVVTVERQWLDGRSADTADVALIAENVGTETITIEGVETTCHCVTSDDVTGMKVKAGGSLLIPVSVSVDEFSGGIQHVYVRHSGPSRVVKFEVRYDASSELPLVNAQSRGSLNFYDLSEIVATREFEFETFEPADAPQWIKGVVSDCDELHCRITSVEVHLEQRTGMVSRTYRVEVGWHKLPVLREVKAKLIAETSYGETAPSVGLVFARTKLTEVSPSAVVIGGDSRKTAEVLFPKSEAIGNWESVGGSVLPGNIVTRWERYEDHDTLVIGVDEWTSQGGDISLFLEDGQGNRVHLPVLVVP